MFGYRATSFFLTSGSGEASTPLNAFDAALLDAKIGDTNLVKLNSILPPRCTEIQPYELPKGTLVPLAYAHRVSSDPGCVISASVAVGLPHDPDAAGLIMEHSMVGDAGSCEAKTREMVREGMEIIRGVPIREIRSISASVRVTKVGAVFAAVVLCP